MENILTPRRFLLNKYSTSKYNECPVPQHHWEDMKEYAEAYHAKLTKAKHDKAIEFANWLHTNYCPTHSLKWVKRNIDSDLFSTKELYEQFNNPLKTK